MKKEIEKTILLWQRDNLARSLSPDSMETYASSARDFMRYFDERGIYKFKQLTDNLIKDYILQQKERGCSARTVNNRLKALRRVCHFYEEEIKPGYVIPNFAFQFEEMTTRMPLSDEEVLKIIKHFSPGDPSSVLVAFILDTGLRSKSVRNVRVEDLDLDYGFVTIRITKNRDMLHLPMSGVLTELLRQYLIENELQEDPLFRNANGGTMYDRSTVYKAVKRYLKKRRRKQKRGAFHMRADIYLVSI